MCLVALFMTLLDVSITNVALPAIGAGVGAQASALQWVVSGYTLAFGLVPIIGGRLGDDHGRRRMFLIGVAGFMASSALVGAAPEPRLLIAGRVVQGLFGGLINPQVAGLVQQMFRGAQRARAFGAIGTIVGVATAVGPLAGGGLIALGGPHLGWRLVFFVNVPIGLATIVMARRWLPPPAPSPRRRQLDLPGAALLGGATFAVLFAAVQYDTARDLRLLWLLVPAALLATGFVVRERHLTHRNRDPLFDLRLFREPSYTVGVALALLYFCGYTGLPLVLSLYYQQGLGYSALRAGLGVTALAVGSAAAATLAGRWVSRLGRPLVVGGLVTFGIGALLIDLVTGPGDHVARRLALPLLVLGLGSGAIITPNQALTLQQVDPVVGGTAGGVLQTAQRIGAAVGQGVISAVFLASLPGTVARMSGPARDAAYGSALSTAVGVTLGFVAAAIILSVVDLVLSRRRAGRAAPADTAALPHGERPAAG